MATKQDKALQEAMASRKNRSVMLDQMDATPFGELAAQTKEISLIPLDAICVSQFQSRVDHSQSLVEDDDRIADLVGTIEREGLLNPVLVRLVPAERVKSAKRLIDIVDTEKKGVPHCGIDSEEGGGHSVAPPLDPTVPLYELIAGEGRSRAHLILGRSVIPAKVLRVTDVQAARALTVDNLVRRSMSDWELYRHILMLRETGAASGQKELASLLGCSRAMIYKLESFGRLPAAVHAILNRQPSLLGASQVSDLHTKKLIEVSPESVIEAVEKVAEGKLLQSGMVGYIERKLASHPKPTRHEFQLTHGKSKIKVVTQPGEVRITGDVNEDALHALLQEHLKGLFNNKTVVEEASTIEVNPSASE